jgi:hypothetical protein
LRHDVREGRAEPCALRLRRRHAFNALSFHS